MVLPFAWLLGVAVTAVTTAVVAHDLGREEGEREGKEKATAKAATTIKNLEKTIKNKEGDIEKIKKEVLQLAGKIAKYYNEQRKSEQFIICLIAAGVAMAACDGNINEDEVRDLREYVLGASEHRLPSHIESKIEQLLNAPPSFEQAILYVETLDQEIWPMIDIILEVVSEADGEVLKSERTFLKQWESYKATQNVRFAMHHQTLAIAQAGSIKAVKRI